MTRIMRQVCSIALVACVFALAACAPPPPVAVSAADQNEAPPRISFIVNFRTSHALGRAQFMQGAGRHDEAARLANVALRDDPTLHGLCFEGFTVGGADIVLNVCEPSRWEEPMLTQRRWFEQLGATPGLVSVERNLVAQHTAEASAS